MADDVMTALGPISSEKLGRTLMHEHLFVNLMREYRATGLVNMMSTLSNELGKFTDEGGGTIVDVTPAELTVGASPNPASSSQLSSGSGGGVATRTPSNVQAIKELANEVSTNIVVGTGHYRDPYLDQGWIDEHSVEEIAECMIRDIEYGFPDSDVRAGIIGEIGADKWYISAREERSFRAAARAQRATGLPVTTHAARWPVGLQQLELLVAESVDPSRIIIGHCDSVLDSEYHEAIAKQGAYVQFDLIRGESLQRTQEAVDLIMNMIRQGYLSQVLLSHDICTLSQLSTYGGVGYSFVITKFSEELRNAGLNEDEINQLLIANPRRALQVN